MVCACICIYVQFYINDKLIKKSSKGEVDEELKL